MWLSWQEQVKRLTLVLGFEASKVGASGVVVGGRPESRAELVSIPRCSVRWSAGVLSHRVRAMAVEPAGGWALRVVGRGP